MENRLITPEESTRCVLARHPVAVDAARAAGAIAKTACEIVVFEKKRAFIVATTEVEVLQPRPLLDSELHLEDPSAPPIARPSDMSFPIRDSFGDVIGALSLRDTSEIESPDAMHALCRIVQESISATSAAGGNDFLEREILAGMRDSVLLLDSALTIRWANRGVGSLLGRTPAELVGLDASTLLHPQDIESALDAITRLQDGREIYRLQLRILRGNGSFAPAEITGVDHSANPSIGGIIVSLRDATGDQELEQSIDHAVQLNNAIVSELFDGIIATDQFGEITMINTAAREIFNISDSTPVGHLKSEDFIVLDRDGRVRDSIFGDDSLFGDETAIPNGSTISQEGVGVIPTRGDVRFVTTQRRSVHSKSGDALGSVIVVHDVTETTNAADELRNQALHDQLTGLPNRRQFENRLALITSSSVSEPIAVLFIDLDGFKLVNDTHGHRSGDEIIRIASKRLIAVLGADQLLVRQGGDEFVVLVENTGEKNDPIRLAELLRSALESPFEVGDQRFDLTASIGVAFAQSDEANGDTLLSQADIALYAAKARGRNRVELFDEELASAVRVEERQRRMLRDALENDRLVMHFQPLIDAETQTTIGYEALARCRDEHGELFGPSSFMDSIAMSALMWDLDRAAFELSCEAAAILQTVTPESPPVIACNFSARSLVQPELVDFMLSVITSHGVKPANICVEITESAAFEAGPGSVDALHQLQAQGFKLALDDFGTGYSSLAHLRDLPLSSVKVDKSFVSELTSHSAERSIAEAIVSLAGDLGLEVVAEGVETSEQLEHAQEMGFTSIQGWHYSPALSLPDVLNNWLHPHSITEP